MNMGLEEMAKAMGEAYESGVADERKRHELRKWDTMPDIEGDYWFSGKYRGYGFADGEWIETRRPIINHVVSDGTVDDGEFSWSRETMSGIWIGPIPNPFQEAA